MNYYGEIKKHAGDEAALDRIIEKAAFDETITHAEYCKIFAAALDAARK